MGLFDLFRREGPKTGSESLQKDVEELRDRMDALESGWKLLSNEWADTYDKLDHLRSRLAQRDRTAKRRETETGAEPEEAPIQPDAFSQLRARRAGRR